jgi:hypothetical protein
MQALPQLAQMPPAFAKIAVKVNPALKASQKREIIEALDAMSQPNPQAAEQAQMQAQAAQERAMAETENIRAQAFQRVAQGEAAAARAYQPQPIPDPGQFIAA